MRNERLEELLSEDLSTKERIKLFRALPDGLKETLALLLLEKRDRAHLIYSITHQILDNPSLEDRYQIIVDGLSSPILGFDAVGLYIPNEDGGLSLVRGKGNLPAYFPPDSEIASFREHFRLDPKGPSHLELIVPCVANSIYQATIFVSNKEGGRAIDPELYHFFHAIADITAGAIYSGREHTKLLKEINRVSELIEGMKGIVSMLGHDIRNSVVTIGGLARRIQKLAQSPEDTKRYAGIVGEVAQSMERLLDELVAFADIQSGYTPQIRPYNLNERLQTICNTLKERANRKVEFSYDLSKKADEIIADPRLMDSILRNLIGNAISHGYGNSPIEVKTEIKDGKLYCSVINDGELLDPSKIFDKFYTTSKRGTGLGCWIIKRNIELHGGKVTARNIPGEPPRVLFEFYIPHIPYIPQ